MSNSITAYGAALQALYEAYSVTGEFYVRPLRIRRFGVCEECGEWSRLTHALKCEDADGRLQNVGLLCQGCAEAYDEI